MIIQCRKCETRFRFDETLIEGDGVWVRCSRCRHVFFQERSTSEPLSSFAAVGTEIPSVRISDARRAPDERFSLDEGHPPLAGVAKEVLSEVEKEPIIERTDVGLEQEPFRGPAPGGEEATENMEEAVPEAEQGKAWWGRTVLKVASLLLLIVLVAGGVYLWLFPEARIQTLNWASPWLREIPGVEKLLGTEMKQVETAPDQVLLKEVHMRSVANLLMGTLRVIEGVAVNQSLYPLAKIRVRLVISDAYDVVIGEKTVYCGNLLTDAELNTLAEGEIQRELSVPQGTDVANERIAPNGEVPFMIVFSQEQAGAIKTVVMPAGADRVS